jgi:hypothetical protein
MSEIAKSIGTRPRREGIGTSDHDDASGNLWHTSCCSDSLMDDDAQHCGACALQPMLAFVHEHTPCGACFVVSVHPADDPRRYRIICSGCRAEFSRPLPGSDARYAVILQGLSHISGN